MKLKTFVCGVGLLAATAVGAQTVDVPSVSGAPGTTVTGTITYADGGSSISSWQADIQYDRPNTGVVAFDECPATTGPASGTINCSVEADGQTNVFRVGIFTVPAAVITGGNVAVFSFTIPAGTAPGVYPMTVDDFAAFDTSGADVTGSLTVTAGDVTVTAPAGQSFYASTPAPGATLDLGTAVVGTAAAAVDSLSIENISPDTPFDVTNVLASDVEVATTAPASFPAPVAAGGSVAATFECTPDARGANTGTIGVEHNADLGPASAVNYSYECTGLAPFINAPAGPINLSGLTVDPGGPQEAFDVVNLDDGLTSDATNFTASIVAGGDPEITVAPNGPLTIAAGATVPFVVSCDNTAAGNFAATVRLEWDQPDAAGGTDFEEIGVACTISDAVPSFASTPASPGPLAFGTVTNGTTSPPLGIDVFNDGVGPSPDSDLTITNFSVDNPQFGVTLVNAGPFEVGTPGDGVADIEVTCTPDAGTTGAFTGFLLVEHDGDDNPTAFDLTCSGESDAAFQSAPAPGGTLNLGVVPPAIQTPPGDITFTNAGAADTFDVACTVTDPDGVFTFTPDPINVSVAPGASEAATFQCTPPAPQIYQAEVACTITGADVATANYFVVCAGQPLVVPTMNRWGLILMAMVLLAIGGFAGRRMMA